MNNILVTGATGHLGRAVTKQLLTKITADQISVLMRNKEKLDEFQSSGFRACLGSYGEIPALEKAMEGIDTVLLISSGDQGDRMQEHRNVVDTALKMGVKNIAYTSRCLHDPKTLANKLMSDHFETEGYIEASGLNYTFFRNILYMDAIPQFIGGNSALEKGIFLPAGDGKVSFALKAEMGEAMANVLVDGGCENKIYRFTGHTAYSFEDIAATLSMLSGKQLKYTEVTTAAFEGTMAQRNLPAQVIRKITDFITDIKNQQEADIYSDLEMQLGRKPAGLKDGLKLLFEL